MKNLFRDWGMRAAAMSAVWSAAAVPEVSAQAAAGSAGSSVSARQAVESLGRAVGTGIHGSLVQVTGVRGSPQPGVWRIVAVASDGVTLNDYAVQGGTVVGSQQVPAAYRSQFPRDVIPKGRVRFDSPDVFMIADRAATASRIGFDALDYDLRAGLGGGEPVWLVRLYDISGELAGDLVVGAESGRVLRGLAPGIQSPQPNIAAAGGAAYPQPGAGASTSGASDGWDRAAAGFERGKDAVKESITHAGSKVRDFFSDLFGNDSASSASTDYGPHGTSSQIPGGSYIVPKPGSPPPPPQRRFY